MKKVKRILAVLLVAAMMASVAACGSSSSSGETAEKTDTTETEAETAEKPSGEAVKIRIAAQFADENPQSQMLYKFKELLEERSNGGFEVELYTNNQLGAAEVWTDMLLEGSIEMGFPGSQINSYYNLYSVTECPFLFSDWDEARYIFTETDIFDQMNAAMPEEVGVRSLGSSPVGFRVTTSNTEINGIEDYEGLRIRVPNVEYCIWEFEALKSNIISMNFSELFTALEQGTVDAQENPYATILSNSLAEVQKYLFDSKHMFTAHFLYVNEAWWQGLDADQQSVIQECVDEASEYGWDLAIESEEDTIKQLEEQGMTIVYPTDEQRAELKQVISDYVWPKFYESYEGSEEYIKMVQEALAAR